MLNSYGQTDLLAVTAWPNTYVTKCVTFSYSQRLPHISWLYFINNPPTCNIQTAISA